MFLTHEEALFIKETKWHKSFTKMRYKGLFGKVWEPKEILHSTKSLTIA